MLNFFKRNRFPAPLPVGADPLKIRNLLDDPRLQAVMNTSVPAEPKTASLTFTSVTERELVLGTAA